jgi:hypothetical protein
MCCLTHSMPLITHPVPPLACAVWVFVCLLVPERSANWGCAGCTSGHTIAHLERAGTGAARGTNGAVQVPASGGVAPNGRLVQRPIRPVLCVWRRPGLTCRLLPRPHIEALLNYSRAIPPFCVLVVYVEACGRPCMFTSCFRASVWQTVHVARCLQRAMVLQAHQAPWHVHCA